MVQEAIAVRDKRIKQFIQFINI